MRTLISAAAVIFGECESGGAVVGATNCTCQTPFDGRHTRTHLPISSYNCLRSKPFGIANTHTLKHPLVALVAVLSRRRRSSFSARTRNNVKSACKSIRILDSIMDDIDTSCSRGRQPECRTQQAHDRLRTLLVRVCACVSRVWCDSSDGVVYACKCVCEHLHNMQSMCVSAINFKIMHAA